MEFPHFFLPQIFSEDAPCVVNMYSFQAINPQKYFYGDVLALTSGGDLNFFCLGAFITGAFGRLMAGDRNKK